MGLLDDIKNQVKKAGTNKQKLVYFKSGTKNRVRFLQDMEDGVKVPFHDSFALGINVPCQLIYGRDCEYCENEELRHRDLYSWSVWDYESNEVKMLFAAVNNFSPVPQLVAMYDTYGTMIDRDYVITKQGSQQTTSFSVVPMDKVKFRNDKAKPFSKAKTLDLIDKAYPSDGTDEDEPKKGKSAKSSSKSQAEPEDTGYDDMSPKQLYDLCIEKDIEVEVKKPKQYYIDKLDEAAIASADDGWNDEEDEPDYSSMTPKELYDICKQKEIVAEPKKTKDYYINLLKAPAADDGWGEEPVDEGW